MWSPRFVSPRGASGTNAWWASGSASELLIAARLRVPGSPAAAASVPVFSALFYYYTGGEVPVIEHTETLVPAIDYTES